MYKMLLLGPIASGKTSLLNLLYNCGLIQALGYEEGSKQLRQFNDNQLENVKSHELESKTCNAKLYNVELGALRVGVIDTPGFGDIRGLEEDKKHAKRIIEVVKQEKYIDCICLVIDGRQSRMNASLRYILTFVTFILPREVLNNIILVFTNTADALDLNFNLRALKEFFGREFNDFFLIENPYCRLEKQKQKQIPYDQIVQSFKMSFDKAGDEIRRMCTTIESFKQVHAHIFDTLCRKTQQIEREVMKLITAYDYQQELEKKITMTEKEVHASQRNQRLNANFQSSRTKPARWIPVDTQHPNTLCGAPGCYSNCHESCYCVAKSFDKKTLKRCWCIKSSTKSDHCAICGHHYTLHYHNEVRWVNTGKTIELVIDQETKRKFEEAKNMEKKAVIVKQHLERDKTTSEKVMKKLSEQLLLTLEEFHKLSINQNYAKLLENQLAIIEHRLIGTAPEAWQYMYLRETKEDIQRKLDLVQATMKEPWSSRADASMQRQWACIILEVKPSATRDEVSKAYRNAARSAHKAGKNDGYFERVERAKDILHRQQ